MIGRKTLLAPAAALLATLGSAGDAAETFPTPTHDTPEAFYHGWPQIMASENDHCAGEVTRLGPYHRIVAYGLRPGSEVRFFLTNGNIVPIDAHFITTASGMAQMFYIPFHWDDDHGEVRVSIHDGECSLQLAFDWDTRIQTLD